MNYSKEEYCKVASYEAETGKLFLQQPTERYCHLGRPEPCWKGDLDTRENVYRVVRTFDEDLLNAFITSEVEVDQGDLDDDEVAVLYKKVLADQQA